MKTAVPSSLQLTPISSCLHDYGNDLVMIFADGHIYPDYVMKISRSTEYSFKIKNEFSALRYLKTVKALQPYIPDPYAIGNCNGHTFLIQRGVQGMSLFRIIGKYGMRQSTYNVLKKAVDLLVSINSVNIPIKSGDFHLKEALPYLLDQYREALISMGLSRQIIDELKEHYHQFSRPDKIYFEHGDYWQTNIIIEDNKICGVIDWEFSLPGTYLPTDIIWFLVNLGHCLNLLRNPDAQLPESFIWAFLKKGEQNEIIRSLFIQYIKGVGLDQNLFKVMLKMTLVKMSLREIAAYGRHTNMDFTCADILKSLIQNERSVTII